MKFGPEEAKKFLGGAGAMGSGPILKALGKFLPGIGQFVSGAYTAGYAADQILDFVKDKLESPASRRNKQQLESRAEQGVARSDEQAALSQMEQQQSPMKALMGLGKLGAQAAGGIASARAGAEQQANEQALQQGQLQQQAQAQQQQQQAREQQQQRQTEQDQYTRMRQQQQDIANRERQKEESEFKKRAEARTIEKHQASMKKPLIKAALKQRSISGQGQMSAEETLKQLYNLANGLE